MCEIRRRTRVVGAFPDGKSALMLAAVRLRHIAGQREYSYKIPIFAHVVMEVRRRKSAE
jgi:hypothetical protein